MKISLHHLREHRLIAMAPGAEANAQPSAAELAETKTEKQNAPKGSVDARAADAAGAAGKAAETTVKSALTAHETAKGAGADGPETRPAMEGVVQALKLPATPDQKPGTEVSMPIHILGSTAAPEQTISLPDYVALTRKADAQMKQEGADEAAKAKQRPDIKTIAANQSTEAPVTTVPIEIRGSTAAPGTEIPIAQYVNVRGNEAGKGSGKARSTEVANGSSTLSKVVEDKPEAPNLSNPLGGGKDRENLAVSQTEVKGQTRGIKMRVDYAQMHKDLKLKTGTETAAPLPTDIEQYSFAELKQNNPDSPALQPSAVAQTARELPKTGSPKPDEAVDAQAGKPKEAGAKQPEGAPKSPEQVALDTAKIDFKKALPPQLVEQGQKFLDSIKTPEDAQAVIQLAQHLAGKETNAKKMMFLRRKTEPKAEEDKEAWNTLQRLFKPVMPTEAGGSEQTDKSPDKGKTDQSPDKKEGEQLSQQELQRISVEGIKLIKEFNGKQLSPEARQKEQSKVEGRLQMMGIDPASIDFSNPDKAAALQGDEFARGLNKFMGMIKYFVEVLDTKKNSKDKDKKTTNKKETKADAPAAKTAEGTPVAPTAKPAEARTPKTAEKTPAAEPKGPESKDAKATPEKPAEDIDAVKTSAEANLKQAILRMSPETEKVFTPNAVLVREQDGKYQVTVDTAVLLNHGIPQNFVDQYLKYSLMKTQDTGSGIARSALMDEKGLREYNTTIHDNLAKSTAQQIEGALKKENGISPEKSLPSFLTFTRLPNGMYQLTLDRKGANSQGIDQSKLTAVEQKYEMHNLNLETGTITSKEMDTDSLQKLAGKALQTRPVQTDFVPFGG
jgi:hypothetical protein